MVNLSDEELGSLVQRELYVALGYDANILADKRARAYDYFTGNTQTSSIPTAEEGRCNIVSADVRDVHGSVLSQIAHCFKSSSVEFEPLHEDDEEQAQLETDVVKLQIERAGGGKMFYSAIHDALLTGTGWIKVWVDEKENVSRETYADVSDPLQVQEILQEPEPGFVEITDNTDGVMKVKRTSIARQLVIESIDPGNIVFSPGLSQYDLQELRFVAERKLYTVAELMESYDLSLEEAMELPSHRDDYWPAIIARESLTGTQGGSYYESSDNELGGKQDATTLKECFHCYMQVDMDGSGYWERWHVVMAGHGSTKVIFKEPHPHIPFVHGSPMPMPHRIEGQGLFELLKEVQDSKTHVLRQLLDNMAVANGSKLAITDGEVNKQDLESGRINGYIRTTGPGHIQEIASTDITGQAGATLDYLDKIRTSRAGASLDLNNSDMQVAQSSAAAAIGEYTAKEKMSTLFASNMVNSLMKGTFLLVHQVMRGSMVGEIGAKIKGKWSTTNPQEWQERNHVICLVGLSSQERKEKIGGLLNLLQMQMGWLQSGAEGVMITKSHIYNTAADYIRAAELGLPEQYVLNPESEESMQAQQAISEQQSQMQQMQAEMTRMQAQLERQKLEQERYLKEQELQWKYYDTNIDAGVKEAEMTIDGAIEREKLASSERVAEKTAQRAGAEGGRNGATQ